jgi:hypothetical protein
VQKQLWDLAETTPTFGAQLKASFPRKEKKPDQSLLVAPAAVNCQVAHHAVNTVLVHPDGASEEHAQKTMMIGVIKTQKLLSAVVDATGGQREDAATPPLSTICGARPLKQSARAHV